MQTKTIVSLTALLALTSAALAAGDVHRKMVIALAGDGGQTRLELDSDEMGFDLHEMQVGENRAFVDTEGRNVLVTREADGFVFEVDGETLRMPALHHGHRPAPGIADIDVDHVGVHMLHGAGAAAGLPSPGVMIISDTAIDEQTQQAIRSLLESAGQPGEVRFIDGPMPHGGPHRIRVIHETAELAE